MIMILKDDKRIFCQISVTHIHNQSKRLKVSLTTDQIRVVNSIGYTYAVLGRGSAARGTR